MPNDLALNLAHGLDPVAFAVDRLGFQPDPWQAELLRSGARQIALNCCRQAGKSTSTAIMALHTALYQPGALILLVSPSQRQSKELFGKVTDFLRALEPAQTLDEDNKLSCALGNGSRIVSLPGDGRTIRGYSAPALVIEDEAGYVTDELYNALRPMLLPSRGRLVLLSTPNGRRGHFFEVWDKGEGWQRIAITGRQCPRIAAGFLDEERAALGPMIFAQEYEGEFIDSQSSAFSSEMVELALADDFERFLAAA